MIQWVTMETGIMASQETVSAETLEYTSRLIERKLADFGVAVKVLAAYPGPVITRYEIEQEHHDHLVCVKCGKIQEFECDMI